MAKKVRFKADAGFIQQQSKRLASDLAFYARGPVVIHLVEGEHIAYTFGTEDKDHSVKVVMNPNSISSVRHRERAIAIWRGIGFHELAHHLWPAEAEYKAATQGGFKSLYNLMDDEQNERRGRAQDPSWGACFQTVCAYIFPSKKRRKDKKISTGIIDDHEDKSEPEGFEAHETYTERWNEFAFHFRRHLPGAKDPQVVEALGLIPKNYKDLSKGELLALCRKIHEVLARGVDAPLPNLFGQATEKKDPSGPAEPDDDPATADGSARGVAWWRVLLHSKWTYATLAVFVMTWSALLFTAGTEFWTQVFWIVVAAVGLLFAGLGIRRLFRWLLKGTATKAEPADMARLRKIWQAIKDGASRARSFLFGWLPRVRLWRILSELVISGWHQVRRFFRFVRRNYYVLQRATVKLWLRLWHKNWFRIAILALPVAAFLVTLISVIIETAEINWWAVALLILWLLAMAILGWILRKQIIGFLTAELLMESDFEHAVNCDIPLDKETLAFNVLNRIVPVAPDPAFIQDVMPEIRPIGQQLRPHLERCGKAWVDRDDQDEGYDLVDELEQIHMGETAVFVEEEEKAKTSLHIEVALDCSTSMLQATETLKQGEKFRLGKCFALAVEEAVTGLSGASSHFWGFTDRQIFDCGEAGQLGVSGLTSEGGNNDSAMLWHMGQSAAASGKQVKILLMISDGQPSDCPWGSLNYLVRQLESDGMIPVQIAVDKIAVPAFERFFVDLVGQTMTEAIFTMGRMLASLVDEG